MGLFAVAASFVRRGMGVAMLKICQKSFLKSFFFLSAYVSFGGCRFFVRQGLGVATLKICQKSFFLIFISFYRRFFLLAVAASSCGRGWGVATLKIWHNLFSCGRGWGVAALKICQKSFLKSLFFRRGSFCGCRYFVRRRGVAALKILQNLFLNPSYPCFNGVCFFCGCSRLRCCGEGSLRSKSGKNLF